MTACPAQAIRGPRSWPLLMARLIAKSTSRGPPTLRMKVTPASSASSGVAVRPDEQLHVGFELGRSRVGPGSASAEMDVHVHQAGHQPAPAKSRTRSSAESRSERIKRVAPIDRSMRALDQDRGSSMAGGRRTG